MKLSQPMYSILIGLMMIQPALALNSVDQSPLYVKKLKSPETYSARNAILNQLSMKSICGATDEMQFVNDYKGDLGQTIAYVSRFKSRVGAMTDSTTALGQKFCSGTLIGPNLFLTASHCIGYDTVGQYIAFNYEKEKNRSSLLKQEFFKITKVVEDGLNGLDFAILQLEGQPGLKYGYAKTRKASLDSNHVLTIIQHPSGFPKKVEVGHYRNKLGSYMEYNDLDTEPGSSGSGVLDKNGDLVAVHTNGGCTSATGPKASGNMGVKMTLIKAISNIL